MHMRTKKWARPELAECPWFLEEPDELRGHWGEDFSRQQPLHVELGCGKGVSTALMVRDNPGVNYLAFDVSADVLGDARRNLERAFAPGEPDNVRLVKGDVSFIGRFLSREDRVERIYISFCNPWPRPKHHKRRLTHPRQLMQYREFLAEDGEIWFKTDDEPLFRDSLESFAACGFQVTWQTEDLHASGFAPNYVSEHERLFSGQGIPIRFAIARKAQLPDSGDAARAQGYKDRNLPEGYVYVNHRPVRRPAQKEERDHGEAESAKADE